MWLAAFGATAASSPPPRRPLLGTNFESTLRSSRSAWDLGAVPSGRRVVALTHFADLTLLGAAGLSALRMRCATFPALDALSIRGRNAKLNLIAISERTPDPDRGYALAALTGELDIRR